MRRVVKFILLLVLSPLFIALFIMLLFWFPSEFVVSSIRLIAATSTVKGELVEAHVVMGGHGTSGARVRYKYVVNGKQYIGKRTGPDLFPGMTYSGGGSLARQYRGVTTVDVHFNPRDPAFSFLEYGWPKWSIGWTLALYGMGLWGITTGMIARRRCAAWLGVCLQGATLATGATGFVVLFLFPPYIYVSKAYYVGLTYCSLFFVFTLYYCLFGDKVTSAATPDNQNLP